MLLPFKVIADKSIDDFSLDEFSSGQVLLVDKPINWTSFQVVNKIKYFILKKFNIKKIKIGHAGTLDPLATGLLIICTGKKTKIISEFQAQPKQYTGTFYLGSTTPSFDLETKVDKNFPIEHITDEMITKATQTLSGEITQTPPIYSAIKINGNRAYKKARNGEQVEIPQRIVHIYNFDISRAKLPEIDFVINCSKGTYIRTMANDFGKELQSGAYLAALRRTQIGDFKI